MATVARGWQGFRVFLDMIKVEHSVFALPFAFLGLMLGSESTGSGPWPGWKTLGLVVLAMVSARSAAMAFNRIVDRDIDALNPRTKARAIPSGLLSLKTANLYFFGSVVVFLGAAAMLNLLSLALAPVALAVTLGYSMTKRFTWLCHFVLGLGLGIAPAAAWIAATGRFDAKVLPFVGAVLLWTAGFDIIYSLQDEAFDTEQGLKSLPQRFGVKRALAVSRICHVVSALLLVFGVWSFGLGVWAWVGTGLVAALLAFEQSLVKAGDLSRVNMAFFTVNGFVSIGFFATVLADRLVGR